MYCMILSAACQHQQTHTGTEPVQLGPISHHAQIIFTIGTTVIMCVPTCRLQIVRIVSTYFCDGGRICKQLNRVLPKRLNSGNKVSFAKKRQKRVECNHVTKY